MESTSHLEISCSPDALCSARSNAASDLSVAILKDIERALRLVAGRPPFRDNSKNQVDKSATRYAPVVTAVCTLNFDVLIGFNNPGTAGEKQEMKVKLS